MGYKQLKAVVSGQTIDSYEDLAGVVPSQTLANSGVYDTGIESLTGFLTVEDSTNGDSAIATVHLNGDTLTIASVAGSSSITATKDTASSVNVYVESGSIQIQNLSGASAVITAKIV